VREIERERERERERVRERERERERVREREREALTEYTHLHRSIEDLHARADFDVLSSHFLAFNVKLVPLLVTVISFLLARKKHIA
jgi:hypothetical protein